MDTTGSAPSTHFPGHFSRSPSPPSSALPAFLSSNDAKPHTDVDIHLPGAYPSSPSPANPPARLSSNGTPEDAIRGAMKRLPSGSDEAHRRRGPGVESIDAREPGCENVTEGIGRVHLHEACTEENETSAYGTPDSRPEDARPPSRIDLHSTSPAPELPTRSPLRSGFAMREQRTKSSAAEPSEADQRGPPSSNDDEDDVTSGPPTGSMGKVVPKPQIQPTLNTIPPQAHVKTGRGVSVDVPGGMLRAPGIEDRIAAGGDLQDADDDAQGDLKEEEEDDSFVDASAEYAQAGGEHSSQHGEVLGDPDADENGRSKLGGESLLSKMKRTLSKAGRNAS